MGNTVLNKFTFNNDNNTKTNKDSEGINENTTSFDKDNEITQQYYERENDKKTGNSFINNLLGRFELFERKEINIKIIDPLKDISNKIIILNEEILDDVLYDYYPDYNSNIIATLNGYMLSKEASLKDNNIQNNDEIYVSEPFEILFSLSEEKKYSVKCSRYQFFFDVFQRFRKRDCPKKYSQRLSACYFDKKLLNSFDIIENLGMKTKAEIRVTFGNNNNTKCLYDKGMEIINKINYVYLKNKENSISIHDIKVELISKNFDKEELKNLTIINFTNLKMLTLIDCNIPDLKFFASIPFVNLQELNLQKNQIPFLEDINLLKLEKLDLSYNYLKKNMLPDKNSKNYKNKNISINMPLLKVLNLSNNKIEDISLLEKLKIDCLKELYLNNNEIDDIQLLKRVPFSKLKKINLSNNKINDINIFSELAFFNYIERIDLMNNEIVNLNVLRNISLPRLKVLNILNNDITDYSVLRLIFFPKLETLYAFPSQLDPDNYDKSSDVYQNFASLCENIKEKGVEIKYTLYD